MHTTYVQSIYICTHNDYTCIQMCATINDKIMAKRKIMLTYGEQTKTESIRVPISKSAEIRERFEGILKEYENPQRIEIDVKESRRSAVKKNYDVLTSKNYIGEMMDVDGLDLLEKKSNPADIDIMKSDEMYKDSKSFPIVQVNLKKPHEFYDAEKAQTNTNEPTQYVKPDVKKEKVKVLQEMADTIKNGGGSKSMSFTTVKKPIDEIYDCICVEKGIPSESDRIYYGANNRIAFWDRDDASVYYANWDNKYYRFANSKEFNKFCKDNQIK